MKTRLILILLIFVLAFTIAACTNGGGSQPGIQSTATAYAATRAYGADQFHIQLTAIAEEDQP